MKNLIFLISILLLSVGAMAQQSIVINIPDFEINGTILKRKASAEKLSYSLGTKTVSVLWRVDFYADDNGAYGTAINRPGINSYFKETVADNTVKVNPSTGEILKPDKDGNYPTGSIGQYDFFFNLAENHDVRVNNLIRSYGEAVSSW